MIQFNDLMQQALLILNAKLKKENTAKRVGGVLRDILNYFKELIDMKASKEELANATTKFKGYYPSSSELQAAYPQAQNQKDFFAWVGATYPGTVWKVSADKGAWTDTGKVPTQPQVNLAEYAKIETPSGTVMRTGNLIGGSGATQEYTPDMNGTTTSAKANSMLVNLDAIVKGKGTLAEITINAADSGSMKIHILTRSGSVFTSVASQIINISAGTAKYNLTLPVDINQYVGVEISTTNASVYVKSPSNVGYYGGGNETSFASVPTHHICYGFKVHLEKSNRPQEVEDFESNILANAQVQTEEYVDQALNNGDILKKSDLVGGNGSRYDYTPDLNGSNNSAKASSMLINALAKASTIGTLSKITINAADNGSIKIHVFTKAGSVFTSIASKELSVTSGINNYNTNIEITSDEHYIGLEISASYASVKTFGQVGKEGFYGGENGSSMTFISGALICYGFTITTGEGEPRPQEVEDFKSEILEEANAYTDTKIRNAMITASAGHFLYRYDMQAENSDFSHSGWSFATSGATPSTQGISGKLFIKKQINIETKIQRCVATLNANTNLVLYTEGKEESTLKTAVSVNASDNTINIYEIFSSNALPAIRASKAISFKIVNGNKYIIEMYRLPRANGIRITDLLTGKTDYTEVYPTQAVHGSDKEVYVGGLQYDQFGIFWNGGTSPKIHELSCGYFGVRSPLLYIVGDSITYGYGINELSLTYAHLIGALTGGDYVVSPRGGGTITGVIEKIQTECAIIMPKFIMVTIGTNRVPSVTELTNLVDAIKTVNAIPIINCITCQENGRQKVANDRILALGEYSCRFDIATSLDPTADILLPDPVLLPPLWSAHPNHEGHKRMAARARIDLPFLF